MKVVDLIAALEKCDGNLNVQIGLSETQESALFKIMYKEINVVAPGTPSSNKAIYLYPYSFLE